MTARYQESVWVEVASEIRVGILFSRGSYSAGTVLGVGTLMVYGPCLASMSGVGRLPILPQRQDIASCQRYCYVAKQQAPRRIAACCPLAGDRVGATDADAAAARA